MIYKNKIIVLLLFLNLFMPVYALESGKYKPVIMIDLDGVLDNYSKYNENEIPKIKKGAKEFLAKLHSEGKYDLILFTTRSPKLATEWLMQNNINQYFKDVTNVKYPAHIYLDDRAVQFNGDYDKTLNDIENFKVYWK